MATESIGQIIIGTWEVASFEIKGQKTSVTNWKTFIFLKNATYKESCRNQDFLSNDQTLKRWKQEAEGVKLFGEKKLKWEVKELRENSLLLWNATDNLVYHCNKVRK